MKYFINKCFVNISNSQEYVDQIKKVLNSKKKTTFFYLNSYSFYLAQNNSIFSSAIAKADFIIADGYSMILLLRLLYKVEIKKVVFTYVFF